MNLTPTTNSQSGPVHPLHHSIKHLSQLNAALQHQLLTFRTELQGKLIPTSVSTKQPLPKTAAAALQSSIQHHNLQESTTISSNVLKATAALVTTVCLHLGHPDTAYAANFQTYFASVTEDRLLETVRGFEARFSGAVNQLKEVTTTFPGSTSSSEPEAVQRGIAARELVQEVWQVVDANFSDVRAAGYTSEKWKELLDKALKKPLRDQSAAYSVVRELLAELHDPYSRFLTPSEFSAMAKYDISGVGLNLGTAREFETKTGQILPEDRRASEQGGGVWVVGLIQGSLADVAGIRQGDELVEADGAPLSGQSPFQVASLLQGQPPDDKEESSPSASTKRESSAVHPIVSLTLRNIQGDTRHVELRRPSPPVTRSPVSYKLEQQNGGASNSKSNSSVGYVKLSSFDARAQRDVAAAVKTLQAQGASRLVLDLRGNRGGLVSEGVEVAKLFLQENDIVVRTEGKSRSSTPISATGPPLTTLPLIVLVDSSTASASEIAAGALRDNCRAVLVGGRTYGKGLIQSVYELQDGSGLVLTVGKYLTPAGIDIDREGLAPEFKNIPSSSKDAENAINACKVSR